MKHKNLNYKEALTEIESIVYKLEHEEPDVDELGGMITNALSLIKTCKHKLKKTESELNTALEDLDEK